MDRRAAIVLQKLATKLDAETYAQVAQEIVTEFAVPQPSIGRTLQALVSPSAPTPVKRQGRPRTPKGEITLAGGPVSRAGQLRALLNTEGPKTAVEIAEKLNFPEKQIHPTLASIGAAPVDVQTDADGYPRKRYGFPVAETVEVQPTLQPI